MDRTVVNGPRCMQPEGLLDIRPWAMPGLALWYAYLSNKRAVHGFTVAKSRVGLEPIQRECAPSRFIEESFRSIRVLEEDGTTVDDWETALLAEWLANIVFDEPFEDAPGPGVYSIGVVHGVQRTVVQTSRQVELVKLDEAFVDNRF